MANVTIIGGHGKVALLAEPQLVEAGHTVNAVIRQAEQADAVGETGARAVVLDIENASAAELEKMFKDTQTDVIVWSTGAGGGDKSRTFAVDQDAAVRTIEVAEKLGIKRYVMVSYMGAGTGHQVDESNGFYAYETAKAVADAFLRDSELDFTILGPGLLTSDDASGIEVGGQPENSDTPRELVAEAIVATIADDSTIGKSIAFSAGSDDVAEALAGAPAKRDFR